MNLPHRLPHVIWRRCCPPRLSVTFYDTGIRAKQIDLPELSFGLLDQSDNLSFVTNINRDRETANSGSNGTSGIEVQICNHDTPGTFMVKALTQPFPNPAATSSDNNDAVFNVHDVSL
jgi:hypothetical protein